MIKKPFQMASVFLLNPWTALQKPHLLDKKEEGEVKKELCRERGLMRLKKKCHFDCKGSSLK